MKLVTEYTFKKLGLEKIDLGVISENEAAIKCYFKAGYKIEKIIPKVIKHGNKLYDKIIMSTQK